MSKSWATGFVAVTLISAAGFLMMRAPAMMRVAPTHKPKKGSLPAWQAQHDAAVAADMGWQATSPAEIPSRGWWAVIKRVANQFIEHRLMAEAASVVFFVLLAIFPALAALVSLYGLFTDPKTIAEHMSALSDILPADSVGILTDQITRVSQNGSSKLSFGLIFGFVVSLWSANQGIKALFDVLNIAYDEREKRSYVQLTLITLGFTFAGLVFTLIALSAVVVLPAVLQFVYLAAETDLLVRLLRWPVMLFIVTLFLSVIYRYGPSRTRARWRWVTWGGASAALAWVLVSLGFSFYVSEFGTYNKTYGSLGAVIGFMTWIWISVMVVLIGAELNAELEHQTARDSTVGPERPLGARGATKADEVVAA
jgi:membrane protein